MFKIGFSKDTHNLISGNEIILGGIKIPCQNSIDAFSDGDVIFHALAEAIFGSLGMNDIGEYYNFKTMKQNFNSQLMVEDAKKYLLENNFIISNVDILIELDNLKLHEWKNLIKNNILKILNINSDQLSIKATTTENNFPNIITCYCHVLIQKGEV